MPEVDRDAVLSAIGRLTQGPTPPGRPRPFRLRNRPDLAILQAGRYRVAYAADDSTQAITVVDVVAHDGAADPPRVAAAT